MPEYVSDAADCPDCGRGWKYEANDGKTYSHVIGVYSLQQDRTVAWQCPFCEKQWPRGARIDGGES